MPRFVLLHHECPPGYEKPSHWDFMLQMGESLATWELRELPASWAGPLKISATATQETVPAIRLPDHRIEYLNFEGPLSRDRGKVQRCDAGAYELISQQTDHYEFRIQGAKIIGNAQLNRSPSGWQLKVDSPQ